MRRPAPGSPTGAERAKRFRVRRFLNATPTDVQFDRELQIVIIENITNESLTPAKAVVLVRERLAKRFSFDGINEVIAKCGDRR
jgi:hypothetical protein